jgi:hypothetical protein
MTPESCWIISFFPFQQQGCQMAHYLTKNPNLGKFWRVLEWKIVVHFMGIGNILRQFGIFYGHMVMLWYFGIFSPLWYIVSRKIWQTCSTIASFKIFFREKNFKQVLYDRGPVNQLTLGAFTSSKYEAKFFFAFLDSRS